MAISERELKAAPTARAVRTARTDARAADLAPINIELQAARARSLRAIAAGLICSRRAPRAVGEWRAETVSQLFARLPMMPDR
jgi:hypothetical protein